MTARRAGGAARADALNGLLRKHSTDAAMILMALPTRPLQDECDDDPRVAREYLQNLERLTDGLPATYLVLAGEKRDMLSNQI